MKCPVCGSVRLLVEHTLSDPDHEYVKRYRRCVSCTHRFPTFEGAVTRRAILHAIRKGAVLQTETCYP